MPTKTVRITGTLIDTNLTNCVVSGFGGGFYAIPELKATTTNRIGTYDLNGARPITYPGSLHIDDEYLIGVGHGNGFGVSSINDSGVISLEYGDSTPANNYTVYYMLAVDYVNKIAITGNYVYDNLTKYDFNGDWANTPTKTVMTEAGNGLPSDEVGSSYLNGLAIAGDYLYISPDDKACTGVFRWNIQTEIAETLTIKSKLTNTYRGWVWYDSPNDRIFMGATSYGTGLICVVDASTAGAEAYSINLSSLLSNIPIIARPIVDSVDPNIITVGARYCVGKLDISDCLDDSLSGYTSTPTKILPTGTPITYSTGYPWFYSGYIRIGASDDLDIMWVLGDRTYGQGLTTGFIDQTTGKLAYVPVISDYREDNNNFGVQYGIEFSKIYSPNNTPYWVTTGYGGDGTKFTVWANSTPPTLQENWWFQTTTITLDDNTPITQVELSGDVGLTIPTGTTGLTQVSNNNGSTWETYTTYGGIHTFTSTGYQFKMKFTGTGTANTSPFFTGGGLYVFLSNEFITSNPVRQNKRIKRFKISGKNG